MVENAIDRREHRDVKGPAQMTKKKGMRVPVADVSDHDAARAWKQFAGNESPVSGVVCLKEWTSKTHVYRLELGPKYTVIAKRKPHRDHLEIKMYNHILPLVGVAVPEVFGELIPRGDEGYWLFMEDLGDERPSLSGPDDRRLVSEWLATRHRSKVPRAFNGEDRGATGYLRVTKALTRTIGDNLEHPWVTEARHATLMRTLRLLERLERNWSRLEAVCSLAPVAIVHGDLAPKNVRVRNIKTGVRPLAVFDWVIAGVGVPARIHFSSIRWRPVSTIPTACVGGVRQMRVTGRTVHLRDLRIGIRLQDASRSPRVGDPCLVFREWSDRTAPVSKT